MAVGFRYSVLIVVALASSYAFINASVQFGQIFIRNHGYATSGPVETGFYVLGVLALLMFTAMGRFTFFRAPKLARNWFRDHAGFATTMGLFASLLFVVVAL